MELCVVSMELWARHMGRHCVVDKIVTFWGREFPFFSGPDLGGHEAEELDELYEPRPVIIELVDHVLQLVLCRVLAQRPDTAAQL